MHDWGQDQRCGRKHVVVAQWRSTKFWKTVSPVPVIKRMTCLRTVNNTYIYIYETHIYKKYRSRNVDHCRVCNVFLTRWGSHPLPIFKCGCLLSLSFWLRSHDEQNNSGISTILNKQKYDLMWWNQEPLRQSWGQTHVLKICQIYHARAVISSSEALWIAWINTWAQPKLDCGVLWIRKADPDWPVKRKQLTSRH
jgi:hypothetical protein